MTTARQAYHEGLAARIVAGPDGKWPEHPYNPYSVYPLNWACVDGWEGRHRPVGVWCDYCWSYDMTLLPDGTLRCRQFPCRERNYPPVDKSKVEEFLARQDAGSFI